MIEDDGGQRIEAEMTAADGPLPPHMVGPYVRRVAYRLMVGLQPYFESHRLTRPTI